MKELILESATTRVALRASDSDKGLEIDVKGISQRVSVQRDGVELMSVDPNGVINADVSGSAYSALFASRIRPQSAPVNALAATGLITIILAQPSDGDTIIVNGHTYTFKGALSIPAVPNEVLIGLANTDTALNLTDAIIADPASVGVLYSTGTIANSFVTATVLLNVVTVASLIKGVIGNGYTLVGSAGAVESGATLGIGAGTILGVDGTQGNQGQIVFDSGYLYLCIATNTIFDNNWRRVDLGAAY